MKKYNILELEVNHVKLNEALEAVTKLAKNRESSYVCFANAHMTVLVNQDPELRNAVNSSSLVFADGAPVAKSFNLIYGLDQKRIAGMDFFPLLLKVCNKEVFNITLLGSTNEVLEKIEARINQEFPQIMIKNKISPPFNKEWDNNYYVNQINSSKSNVVFVALGCPLQEKWMCENYKNIKAVMLGVGGAFPVYAGTLKRSPKWMAHNGMEWLFRLIKEPKRMWKRYLVTNTLFIYFLIQRLLKI